MQIYSIFINTISSRPFLKGVSIIFAYILWSVVSNYNYYSVRICVPIAFYNSKNTNVFPRISCPETVFIELYAKKHNIKKLDIENIAVHIDMQNLKNGLNQYNIKNENLFLPQNIHLKSYSPSNINIIVE